MNHHFQKCAIDNGNDKYFMSEEKLNWCDAVASIQFTSFWKKWISIPTIVKVFINHIDTENLLIHDEDNLLCYAKNLCYLLSEFHNSHSRLERRDLPNYLNLFSFMVNEPYNILEIVKMIKLYVTPKTLHYREFYSKK